MQITAIATLKGWLHKESLLKYFRS